MNNYIEFIRIPVPDDRRTSVWDVRSTHSNEVLGQIRWFGRWRQYAMFPAPNTIWNHDCLRSVEDFIKMLMSQRKRVS